MGAGGGAEPDPRARCGALGAAGHRLAARAGEQHVRAGRLDRAAACFRSALDQREGFPMALFGLGEVYEGLGNPARAADLYAEAAAAWPEYYDAFIRLGRLQDAAGDRAQALESFQEVLRIRPDWPLGYEEVAQHHVRHGAHEAAEQTYRESFEAVQAASPGLHYGLAKVYLAQGQLQRCILEAEKAFRLAPAFGMAHHVRGLCLERNGEEEEGLREFRKAVDLEGDEFDHYESLARSLERAGGDGWRDEVTAVWERAKTALPQDGRVRAAAYSKGEDHSSSEIEL